MRYYGPRMDENVHPARRVLNSQGRRDAWVASELSITKDHLQRILRGTVRAPRWFYPELAALLGVPVADLKPDAQASDAASIAA